MTAAEVVELYDEIQRLQRALTFWMPCVPDPGEVPEGCCERLMDDAMLLAGFDGPTEKSAEELGWVKLQPPSKVQTDLDYVTQQRDIAWGAIQAIKSGAPHWIGVASDDVLAWAQSEADKGLAAVTSPTSSEQQT